MNIQAHMKSKIWPIIVAILIFSCSQSFAEQIVRIIDGDTLELNGDTIRLHGIDAPEAGQKCVKAGGGSWPCGNDAIAEIEAFTKGQAVTCAPLGRDDYDRILAICHAGGQDIGSHMIATGLAWAFTKFSNDYVPKERDARVAKIGVWQAPTQTAWEFRAQRWEVGIQTAPDGCPIKGNISKNGRIYHAPWSPWYARTKVSTNRAERWFCSEAEAIEAGWRAPYWGR